MTQEANAEEERARSWWVNCGAAHDGSFREDRELTAIDAMEDAVAPLDEQTIAIRRLITGFESCYHEADKEARRIAAAIGAGRCQKESTKRPPKRKRELENCRSILSQWCEGASVRGVNLDVGHFSAVELTGLMAEPSDLKIWQAARIVDKVAQALDPGRPYHRMALDVDGYGEPLEFPPEQYYKDNADFLEQTKETIIHYTEDGREAQISLAMAIDLLMPCHWDFVGLLAVILGAIGGNLHPAEPFTCCSINLSLSPLCPILRTISNTLGAFWKDRKVTQDTDSTLFESLGERTPVKRWLAASLDKTIRLQLQF